MKIKAGKPLTILDYKDNYYPIQEKHTIQFVEFVKKTNSCLYQGYCKIDIEIPAVEKTVDNINNTKKSDLEFTIKKIIITSDINIESKMKEMKEKILNDLIFFNKIKEDEINNKFSSIKKCIRENIINKAKEAAQELGF